MKSVLATLSLFIFLVVHSQENHYKFSRLTKDDGLPGSNVTCFLKDDQGFMWIGTTKGLCRYDGHSFKHYTRKEGFGISDDWINGLFEDSEGLIWIGTNIGGVNVYDPIMDTIKVYLHDPNNLNSIPGNRVNTFSEDLDGSIWIGFNNNIGLSRIDKKTGSIKNYDPFVSLTSGVRSIRPIIVDEIRPDTLWLGTTSGLIAFSKKEERFQLVDHPLLSINRHGLFDAWKLNENQIVGAFFHAGTDIYNIKDGIWSGITTPLENPTRVVGLAPKSDHELWLAARKKGLAVLDLNTGMINRVPSEMENHNSPFPGFTNTVFSEGRNLWVGGVNGISFYDGGQLIFPFDSLQFHHKEFGRITSASGQYDKMYLAGIQGEGLWEIDKLTGDQQVIRFQGGEQIPINGMLELENKVLLSEDGNRIIVVDKSTRNQVAIDLSKKIKGKFAVRDLKFWKDQLVLVITWHSGVQVLDLNNYAVWPLFEQNENIPPYHDALVTKDKSIWFSTDKDIVIYHPDGDSASNYSPASIPNKKNKRILSISEAADGTKWIGCLNGLIRLHDGKETLINSFNSNLASDYIRKIEIDKKGRLWLETDVGISVLDPNTLRVTNYGATEQIRPAGAFTFIDDKLLVGQYGGYSFFDPDSLSTSAENPEVHFIDFKVSNSTFSLDRHINYTDHIVLGYKENFITFEFTAPKFSKSQKIYFSYMLVGLDHDWVDANTRRRANYTDLDGGNYTFLVRARNEVGEWTAPRSILIHVSSPFWDTWWFYSLCVTAVISTGFGFYKYRTNLLQRRADQEAQELRLEAFQKRLTELNATPPDLTLDFEELNAKLNNPLSEREFEALKLSLDGKTNAEIADRLFISKSTVKFHLRNAYSKLGVQNRKEALKYISRTSA